LSTLAYQVELCYLKNVNSALVPDKRTHRPQALHCYPQTTDFISHTFLLDPYLTPNIYILYSSSTSISPKMPFLIYRTRSLENSFSLTIVNIH
jgi:hypothetical protein